MASTRSTVYITVFLGLFSHVYGILSMQFDVPDNLTQQTLNLCPCTLGEECNTTVIVPMMESSSSLEWFVVSSTSFQSSATHALECENQQLHLTITEGSFTLLATGELFHVHSKLILPNSSFCLKRSYSQDYVVQESQRLQQVILQAEICMTPPAMKLCCSSGSIVSQSTPSNTESNTTFSCVPSSAPPLVPPIFFDGSSHKWPLGRQVQGFPPCHQNLSAVSINVGQPRFGHLQLTENRLQFRWQPGPREKFLSVDSSQYCIGQERSYGSLQPVVAVCQPEHKPEEYCQTSSCFGKCCPDDQIYDLDSLSCVASSFTYTWSPVREAVGEYQMVYGMPSCESFFPISITDPEDSFSFLGNGSIQIDSWTNAVSVPDYCFDVFLNQTHAVGMALVCFGDEASKPNDHLDDESTVLDVLSSVLFIGAPLADLIGLLP